VFGNGVFGKSRGPRLSISEGFCNIIWSRGGETMIVSGWKEIAGHLRRGVRTVQRWEQYGLPIRRPAGRSRSAVFAISEEIDKWARSRSNGRPERKALGTYLRLHPIARIQETFSETEKLMAALKLHAAKQRPHQEMFVRWSNIHRCRAGSPRRALPASHGCGSGGSTAPPCGSHAWDQDAGPPGPIWRILAPMVGISM
jgi:hypothetical protein